MGTAVALGTHTREATPDLRLVGSDETETPTVSNATAEEPNASEQVYENALSMIDATVAEVRAALEQRDPVRIVEALRSLERLPLEPSVITAHMYAIHSDPMMGLEYGTRYSPSEPHETVGFTD